jgi:hypothetical protein
MKNILLILFLISAAVACQYGREFAQDNEALAKLVRIDTLYRKNDAYEKLFYWQFLDNGEVRQCRVSWQINAPSASLKCARGPLS